MKGALAKMFTRRHIAAPAPAAHFGTNAVPTLACDETRCHQWGGAGGAGGQN